VAVLAALVVLAVYWNYGTLTPCGVLREIVRQRDGLAVVLPDSVVDLAIAGQFGALSPERCLAIIAKNVTTPIPKAVQVYPPQTVQPTTRQNSQPVRKN
jgi:hypothetical protein